MVVGDQPADSCRARFLRFPKSKGFRCFGLNHKVLMKSKEGSYCFQRKLQNACNFSNNNFENAFLPRQGHDIKKTNHKKYSNEISPKSLAIGDQQADSWHACFFFRFVKSKGFLGFGPNHRILMKSKEGSYCF